MGENQDLRTIIATDVGSTTTKAILIEKQDGEYRLVSRGEMQTTVEKPWENVMIGVRRSIRLVEEMVDRRFLHETDDGEIELLHSDESSEGEVDYYVSTSSAGGGLQMMVAGLVSSISASSAHRAALGAGAVVLDVIAVDDGRSTSEHITRIRELRPDIILLSGGVDGGSVSYLAAMAETILQANPQPRFGATYQLPVVYAGNKDAQDLVQAILQEKLDTHIVPNLRPRHDVENLGPARERIHELFMNHVMAQAPGYEELMDWVDTTIMPTPGAVGSLIHTMAENYDANIVGVDIGGATTDIFSDFEGTFTRTVSANLGMSYSITNVYEESGFEKVRRWCPFGVSEEQLCDWISNKMVRPTTIPQTMDQLILEHALAREALRRSFEHHESLARKVEGQEAVAGWRQESAMFKSKGQQIIEMMDLDMLVGSGGVLSHAPRREQAALMLLDSFEPEGVTQLAVDSIFMMPHLGVLASTHPECAAEVFDKDCLVRLGTVIAPVGKSRIGRDCVAVEIEMPSGETVTREVPYGSISRVELGVGEKANVTITPDRNFSVGEEKGEAVETEVEGGLVGIIIDARGRPLQLPDRESQRVERLTQWIEELDAYPIDKVQQYQEESPVADEQEEEGEKLGWLARLFKR